MAFAGWEQHRVERVSPSSPPEGRGLHAIEAILHHLDLQAQARVVAFYNLTNISTTGFTSGGTPGEIIFPSRAYAVTLINDGAVNVNYRVPYRNWVTAGQLNVGETITFSGPEPWLVSIGLQSVTGTGAVRVVAVCPAPV